MNNLWLEIASARKIAAEIQLKYCGQSYLDNPELENKIIAHFKKHPDRTVDMMLEIHWDDADCMAWVQIELVDSDFLKVPR